MKTTPPTQQPNTTKSSTAPYVFLVLFASSLFANVYFARSLTRLNHLVSESKSSTTKIENKVGGVVNALSVQTPLGGAQSLRLAGSQDTVVYIFSPNCHWCALNLKSIRSLAEQRNSSYRFIGISSYSSKESLVKYLANNPLPFPVFVDDSPDDLASLDFTGTPQTLLIRKDGTVEYNWIGAFGKDVVGSVEKAFSVKLPDITGSYASKAGNDLQVTKAGAS